MSELEQESNDTKDTTAHVEESTEDHAETIKALKSEIDSLKGRFQLVEGSAKKFRDHFKDVIATKDKEIDAATKELKIARSRAMREGEDDEVVSIEERLEILNKKKQELKDQEKESHPEQQSHVSNPTVDAWIKDGNDWFRTDEKLRNYARSLSEELRASGNKKQGRAFLDEISALMAIEFPRKFAKSAISNGVESGSSSVSLERSKSGKSAKDLPEEDRKIMKQLIKEGLHTEKSFLDSYYSR